MCFTWPDPISLVADIVTIVGIPVLAVATWNLYLQVRKARQLKAVSEDCVSFHDVVLKCGINLVPFKQLAAIPRPGDHISLPGETDEQRNYGGGWYEVVSVEFHYRGDRESDRQTPATTSVIQINVRKLVSHSD